MAVAAVTCRQSVDLVMGSFSPGWTQKGTAHTKSLLDMIQRRKTMWYKLPSAAMPADADNQYVRDEGRSAPVLLLKCNIFVSSKIAAKRLLQQFGLARERECCVIYCADSCTGFERFIKIAAYLAKVM